MKKHSLNILLFACFLFAAGCTNQEEKKAGTAEHTGNSLPVQENTSKIRLDSAEQQIANYAGFCKVNNWNNGVRAFRISSYDLLSSIGKSIDSDVKDVRVYIGIKGSDVANDFHLFITPLKVGTDQDSIPYYGTDSAFVYDLTTPCPKTCDDKSALYNAFNAAKSNIKWKPAKE